MISVTSMLSHTVPNEPSAAPVAPWPSVFFATFDVGLVEKPNSSAALFRRAVNVVVSSLFFLWSFASPETTSAKDQASAD
jgi:hypothetical protein